MPTLPSPAELDRLSLGNLQQLRSMYPEGSPQWVDLTERITGGGSTMTTRKLSSVPAHLQQEKDVEQDIDFELERYGFDVVRFSQARASRQTEGTPDRYARHTGRHLRFWIEVKQPGGTVSADQKAWHKTERDAGGKVITVWSVQDLADELRALGVPIL